jgi:hypothetical protein
VKVAVLLLVRVNHQIESAIFHDDSSAFQYATSHEVGNHILYILSDNIPLVISRASTDKS